jgi:hypothetical protein
MIMFSEITRAIVDVIHSQPGATISSLTTIAGLIVGAVGTLSLEAWHNRGKVKIFTMYLWKHGSPGWKNMQCFCCEFSLHAMNTLPNEKSLVVAEVKYYGNRDELLFTDPYPKIGFDRNSGKNQDILLPPKSFTRIHISSYTPLDKSNPPPLKKLESIRSVRVEFLVLPAKRFTCRYEIASAVDVSDEKNQELVREKLTG